MSHIHRFEEIEKRGINEARDLHIQKAGNTPSVYVILRLYNKRGTYEWLEEPGSFSTVERAEAHIKTIGAMTPRNATNRFQIIERRQIELVDYGEPMFENLQDIQDDRVIREGDYVMWRGNWGKSAPKQVRVTRIELCNSKGEKYGERVREVSVADLDRTVFVLGNGHWCYGNQIDPIW